MNSQNSKMVLSQEMIDQVIFAMENQSEEFGLDLRRQVVLPLSELEEEAEAYLSVPPWSPAEGYRLMERFVLSLKNPLYREILKDCLSAGTGVFRRFKDTLKERPDIERLWFVFKRKEMRLFITDWVSRQLEGQAAVRLGPEPEETDDLILADFSFTFLGVEHIDELASRDEEIFRESCFREDPGYAAILYEAEKRAWGSLPESAKLESWSGLGAFNPQGVLAGYVWGRYRGAEGGDCQGCPFLVQRIYVESDYRGLGLAEKLLDRFFSHHMQQGASRIDMAVPRDASFMEPVLERLGFGESCRVFSLSRSHWVLEDSPEEI